MTDRELTAESNNHATGPHDPAARTNDHVPRRWGEWSSHGPSDLVMGPSDLVMGPSDLVTGPSDLVMGPSDLVTGPSDLVTGPSDNVAGPSDHVARPSDLKVAGPKTVNWNE